MEEQEIDGILGADILFPTKAVLDCRRRLLYLNGDPDSGDPIPGVNYRGFQSVPIQVSDGYNLYVAGAINDRPARLMVDTGAYLTMLDADFAKRAKIGGVRTRISAQGIGKSSGEISLAVFPSLRVGSYEIKRGSATVGVLDPEAIGRGTDSEVAGLLGVEHLAMNSAIFDFVTRTMYLRPPPR